MGQTFLLVVFTAGILAAETLPGGFQFQTLSTPSISNFRPQAINASGVVVGYYTDSNNRKHGVVRQANGTVVVVDYPGATDTILTGINNSGVAVGTYYINNVASGFLRLANGTLQAINIPGVTNVSFYAIDNNGWLVGSQGTHAIIYESNGTYRTFDVNNTPGVSTVAYGISESGQIFGTYTVPRIGGQQDVGCFLRDAAGQITLPDCSALYGVGANGLLLASDLMGANNTPRYYLRDASDEQRVFIFGPNEPLSGTSNRTVVTGINSNNQIIGIDPSGNAFLANPCDASIGFSAQNVTAAGMQVTVPVATNSTCTWAGGVVGSGNAFVVPGTLSGTGPGTFNFQVQGNSTSSADRIAALFIAGRRFDVTQAGSGCTATFASSSFTATPAGGTGNVGISAGPGCNYTASTSSPFIQLMNQSGSGNGVLNFFVATNTTSASRTGTIIIGNQVFTITQPGAPSGCTFTVVPGTTSFSANGGNSTVQVTTGTGCAYSVFTNSPSFITPSPGGSGSGTVNFTVSPNMTTSARVATISIAGTNITINQAGTGLSGGLGFIPVTPCRLVDTRNAAGLFGGPVIGAGTTRIFPVPQGTCNVPSTARAYSVNVTVVPRGPLSYLTLFPTGQNGPNVSTLNAFEGQTVANAAIVPAGTGGSITAFATDATDLIIDVNGYFVDPSTPNALLFYPVTPCRVIDTRPNSGLPNAFGAPSLAAGVARNFAPRQSNCGIPSTAAAYVTNVTAVPTSPLDFLTLYPAGQTRPNVSTLNSMQGRTLANAAIVPAGTNGEISLFAPQTTDVVVDIVGYFAPPATNGLKFYALEPCRLADTRTGFGFTGTDGPPSLVSGANRNFSAGGRCGVPLNASAVSLNVTVVPNGPLGYLTLYGGGTRPLASTLNAQEGQIVANAAIVPLTATGELTAYATSATDLILDVNGYFAP